MIPYILIYVLGNYMLGILTFIVPFMIYKINKKYVVTLLNSCIVFIISLFIIIPFLLLIKNNYQISIKSYLELYNLGTFKIKLIKNAIITLLFIIIGYIYLIGKKYKFKNSTIVVLLFIILTTIISVNLIKEDNKNIKKFNLNYKTQTIKIKNQKIILPKQFYKINKNEYTLKDMTEGSSDYNNSYIKYIYVDYLEDYEFKEAEEIDIKTVKKENYQATKIRKINNNMLIIGKDKEKNIYYDYYINKDKNTLSMRFIINDDNKNTQKAINKIIKNML